MENLILVQRHCPKTHEAVFMLCHCRFSHHSPWLSGILAILLALICCILDSARVVEIPAQVTEVIMAASLHVPHQNFTPDPNYITGLHGELHTLYTLIQFHSYLCRTSNDYSIKEGSRNGTSMTWVHLWHFPPGSVLGFRAKLFPEQQAAFTAIKTHLDQSQTLQSLCDSLSGRLISMYK